MSSRAAVPVVVKKYANRRLYNTQTSCYVSLADIFDMVKRGEEFVVTDVKTGKDITHAILTQVIFDQESRGLSLLPAGFLRQLIRFYGHSSGPVVAQYLQQSMQYFTEHQENMARMFSGAAEAATPNVYRDMLKRHMDWWQNAWKFPGVGSTDENEEGKE
jgi:polyhydroxyalkanoate synthesis repressor PhaR